MEFSDPTQRWRLKRATRYRRHAPESERLGWIVGAFAAASRSGCRWPYRTRIIRRQPMNVRVRWDPCGWQRELKRPGTPVPWRAIVRYGGFRPDRAGFSF